MKTLEELRAFCEGYRTAMLTCYATLQGVDDWIVWGGYDINIFGSDWGIRLEGNPTALSVDAYPAEWKGDMPEALHTLDIKGESK